MMMQMMTVPQVRTRLEELAAELGHPELADLADALKRRPPARRAPAASPPTTHGLRNRIRQHARLNPDMTQQAIAEVFGVNQGRVSEALSGKRA